jgi:zinc D-Ala-D-Ala carboxypeptidase
MNIKLKYFKDDEFKCKCGCGFDITFPFKMALDMAREEAGVPFVINSGARCIKHNEKVGGAKNSAHLRGLAVDIKNDWNDEIATTKRLMALSNICRNFQVMRIGINKRLGFIHIDIDHSLPNPSIFKY